MANIAEWRRPFLCQAGSMTAPISIHQHDRLLTRRGIFTGAAALLVCAPAIVRASSLIPLRQLALPIGPRHGGFCERLFYAALDSDLRAGRMRTVLNGKIVTEVEARRIVAQART
jgi:hypothetical protein